jgi:hypothetical protein
MNLSRFCALAAAAMLLSLASAAQAQGPDLNGLHAALHLTPDQEPAWRVFTAASMPTPQDEARERSAQQMMATLRAPQRVDLATANLEADLDALRARGAALKAFYAGLTPAQQLIFDRETLPRSGPDDQ